MEKIEQVLFINLNHRKDRLDHILSQVKMAGLETKTKRFEAVGHRFGIIGCAMSHLGALELAKKSGWKNVLILEDDFTFCDVERFEAKVKEYFDVFSSNYPVFLLAHNMLRGHAVSGDFFRVSFAQTASGYIVCEPAYNVLIENFREGISKAEESVKNGASKVPHELCFDVFWNRALKDRIATLTVRSRLGYQFPSFSDIEKRNVNYGC